MATRPIFIPTKEKPGVRVATIEFNWFPGLSLPQKQKCIESLHTAATEQHGVGNVLEISSKSQVKIGRELSAFNLTFKENHVSQLTVEAAFQGSKIFQQGGPYTDLYAASPRDAKRDLRLRNSGPLIGFMYSARHWPLEPKTLFYDWLYLSALRQNPQKAKQLLYYEGFTDIEFNPSRSFSCQARSAALYVHLSKQGLLESKMESPDAFERYISNLNISDSAAADENNNEQLNLF